MYFHSLWLRFFLFQSSFVIYGSIFHRNTNTISVESISGIRTVSQNTKNIAYHGSASKIYHIFMWYYVSVSSPKCPPKRPFGYETVLLLLHNAPILFRIYFNKKLKGLFCLWPKWSWIYQSVCICMYISCILMFGSLEIKLYDQQCELVRLLKSYFCNFDVFKHFYSMVLKHRYHTRAVSVFWKT